MNLKDKVINTLCELISINSVSGKENRIIDFIERRLINSGFNPVRDEVSGERANLYLEGRGDTLISCHVDTVPPAGMKNAFRPALKDGKIIGRGASDVKGPLASLLVALEEFAKRRDPENLPCSVAFVVDEETNSAAGSERAALYFKGKAKNCLVLEPTYGKFCTSQMGSLEFSVIVEGEGAHASEFEKVQNPIRVLMDLISLIEQSLNRSVNVLSLKGGTGIYAVPTRATALLEVKVFRDENWEEIWSTIEQFKGKIISSCRITLRVEDAENFIDFLSEDFAESLMKVYEEATSLKAVVGVMPSWTDGANYHRLGFKTVVFGTSNLLVSHTPKEYVEEEELVRMNLFFLKMFEKMA
jgi:acetylornithine deacetylase/succinyl-diaminopimelate desuccinylase